MKPLTGCCLYVSKELQLNFIYWFIEIQRFKYRTFRKIIFQVEERWMILLKLANLINLAINRLEKPALRGKLNVLSLARRALNDKFPTPKFPITAVLSNRHIFLPDPVYIYIHIYIYIYIYVSTGLRISVDSTTNTPRRKDTPTESQKCVIGQTGCIKREKDFFFQGYKVIKR